MEAPNSTIRQSTKNDLSFFMSLIHFVVRSFRSQISQRQPKRADGSIQLKPSTSSLQNCTVTERKVCDIYIYDIVLPRRTEKPPTKHIYYFAGGSWQKPPTGQHYRICAKMALDIPDTTISIVSMPLAPNHPAPSAFPWCLKLYRTLMAEAKEAGERVILAGDSSGANIILCLTLEALREDADRFGVDMNQLPHPHAIMAICPSTDLTRNNPDIQKIAPKDPLLTPDIIKGTARAWHAAWDPADRRVSPINNDISLLAKRGIKIHGLTGGYDVLSPDGIIFRDRCAEEGVEGDWVHWERQMHCFILTMPYGLKEAKVGVQWIIDVLRKE